MENFNDVMDEVTQDTVETISLAMDTVGLFVDAVWTVLDAASQKPIPSEYLSPPGVQAMQGNGPKA